jgi:hypothetical protein
MKRKNTIYWNCHGVCNEKCLYKYVCVACFPKSTDKFEQGTKMKLTLIVEDNRNKKVKPK